MPKPFKPTRPFKLPADAELVDVDGKPHVRMKERGKPVLYRISKDGTKYLRPAKRWYFDIPDANGKPKRVKGFSDLKATEQLAVEMERKASRVRSGFSDPAEEHLRRPLADHLKDYAACLEAKGDTSKHVNTTISRISAILSGCGAVFLPDVNSGKVSEWIVRQRRDGTRVELPAGVDEFRTSEAAAILGITVSTVNHALLRHHLATTGNGKARRLPRATVAALAASAARGVGPSTFNHHVTAIRGFFRWLVRSKRIGSNPLDTLTLVNAAVDVRHARRELSADELRRLFVATRESECTFRGLTGVDRYFLYLTAAGTGFRANALANLTPADFDLDAGSPVVTLAARFNKSRRTKVQPLPSDVAVALRDFLTEKPANLPIWGAARAKDCRGAEMIRRDLETAGIAYAVEGPDGLEYADFHALRHSYLTLGGRSGIDLRTLQELAGHSKPELTARYSHRRLHDLAGAVGKLPNLVPTCSTAKAAELPLRLTGTDGANVTKSAVPDAAGAVPDAVTGGTRGHQSASPCNFRVVGGNETDVSQPLENVGTGASQHRPASPGIGVSSQHRPNDDSISYPRAVSRKSKTSKQLTPQPIFKRSAGCSETTDPGLALVISAWATLPEPIRRAMLALIGSSDPAETVPPVPPWGG